MELDRAVLNRDVTKAQIEAAKAGVVLKKPRPARGAFKLFNVVFDRIRDGTALRCRCCP